MRSLSREGIRRKEPEPGCTLRALCMFFFFQAEDGIRDLTVTGVQTCALPISAAEGYTIQASDLGKTKMFSQVVAISCMLLSVRHPELSRMGLFLMWAVVFFAIASAVSYFGKFWHKVDESIKGRRRRELLVLERKRQRAAMRQRRTMGAGAGASEGGL